MGDNVAKWINKWVPIGFADSVNDGRANLALSAQNPYSGGINNGHYGNNNRDKWAILRQYGHKARYWQGQYGHNG